MSRVINPDTMSRKMKRASTLPAAVEARSGHNGKLSNISCSTRFRVTRSCLTRCCLGQSSSRWRGFLQPEQDEDQAAEKEDGDATSDPQHIAHGRSVFSGCRI